MTVCAHKNNLQHDNCTWIKYYCIDVWLYPCMDYVHVHTLHKSTHWNTCKAKLPISSLLSLSLSLSSIFPHDWDQEDIWNHLRCQKVNRSHWKINVHVDKVMSPKSTCAGITPISSNWDYLHVYYVLYIYTPVCSSLLLLLFLASPHWLSSLLISLLLSDTNRVDNEACIF